MKHIIKFLFGNNEIQNENDIIENMLVEFDIFVMQNEIKKDLAIIDMLVDNLIENDSDFLLIKF